MIDDAGTYGSIKTAIERTARLTACMICKTLDYEDSNKECSECKVWCHEKCIVVTKKRFTCVMCNTEQPMDDKMNKKNGKKAKVAK